MTQNLSQYKFSRREVARHRCKDCGVNVIKAGDYCMLHDRIWKGQFGLGWDDNLCLACIEERLGREVTVLDFSSFPWVEGYPMSDVLHSRLAPKKKRS